MSRTRQLATSGSLFLSISGPEPKTLTAHPTDLKRLVSALRMDAASSITKTIGSLALAVSGEDLGRSITTHPLDAGAGRIETWHRGVHLPWPRGGHHGPP